MYERQELIEGLTIPKIATVVGCGGTGFWTALLLAMSGTKELILFDDDTIEETNLARLPLKTVWIGHSKLEAVSGMIRDLRREVRVETHNNKIDTEAMCTYLRGSVFCCTDNIPSQQLICAFCRKNNLPYQRIGYDGTILNVSRGFPLTFDDKFAAGYEVTPSWVIPAVLAAAAGISSQCLSGGEIILMDDIRRLHIQDSTNMSGDMVKKIKQDAEKRVIDYPADFGLGDCEGCDRSDCSECERISDDDYGTMRNIVCEDCDYIAPDNIPNEVIVALNGEWTPAMKAVIESRYILQPRNYPGQMGLDSLTTGPT